MYHVPYADEVRSMKEKNKLGTRMHCFAVLLHELMVVITCSLGPIRLWKFIWGVNTKRYTSAHGF